MTAPQMLQFNRDIQPHLAGLFRTAYRLTGNLPDAEELMQETCIRALTHLTVPDAGKSTAAWLMRVQYNLYVDTYRRRRRAVSVALDDVDPAALVAAEDSEPDWAASQDQHVAAIDRAMAKLNADQRALLVLRVEGYTLAEIQEITGLEIGSLNARLHRARQSLARHLRAEREAQPPRIRLESGR